MVRVFTHTEGYHIFFIFFLLFLKTLAEIFRIISDNINNAIIHRDIFKIRSCMIITWILRHTWLYRQIEQRSKYSSYPVWKKPRIQVFD